MKKKKIIAFVLIVGAFPYVHASSKQSQPNMYVDGTVVRVEKHEAAQSSPGSNPSDAPLPDPETYDYDVAVQVSCGTYVGRYESWYDYLPSLLAANQKIHLRLTRRAMYVNVPNQKDLQMRIVSRAAEHGTCNGAKS